MLAAAVIVGALLTAVPLLILTRHDRDAPRAADTAAAETADDTVLGAALPSAPGDYAAATPSAKRAASPSVSVSGTTAKAPTRKDAASAEPRSEPTPAPRTTPRKPPPVSATPKSAEGNGKSPSKTGYFLIAGGAGMCLDPSSAGGRLRIERCNDQDEQRWDLRPDGTARADGLCMTSPSSASGSAMRTARCDGSRAQQFHLNKTTNNLVSQLSSKCVDVYNLGTTAGTPVIVWPCDGADNQKWYQWIDH
ncbi:RICIN domain-containing protein [Streptomyces sp. NPDC091281]|uniref:RICIN domain-containing protein n=1 Tax=Streptomyces sp. NPDC091281 TaxID=3365985 RepID=UPI0038258762